MLFCAWVKQCRVSWASHCIVQPNKMCSFKTKSKLQKSSGNIWPDFVWPDIQLKTVGYETKKASSFCSPWDAPLSHCSGLHCYDVCHPSPQSQEDLVVGHPLWVSVLCPRHGEMISILINGEGFNAHKGVYVHRRPLLSVNGETCPRVHFDTRLGIKFRANVSNAGDDSRGRTGTGKLPLSINSHACDINLGLSTFRLSL